MRTNLLMLSIMMMTVMARAEVMAITSLNYDPIMDQLVVDFTYGGGCLPHEFALEMGSTYDRGGRPIYDFHLYETEGGDDNCKMIVQDSRAFSMQEVRSRPAQINVYRGGTHTLPLTIDIDDYPWATVNNAVYDATTHEIVADISYSGGCMEHEFALKVGLCNMSFPPRCMANIIHVRGADDACEMWISETRRLSVPNDLLDAVLTINNRDGSNVRVRITP